MPGGGLCLPESPSVPQFPLLMILTVIMRMIMLEDVGLYWPWKQWISPGWLYTNDASKQMHAPCRPRECQPSPLLRRLQTLSGRQNIPFHLQPSPQRKFFCPLLPTVLDLDVGSNERQSSFQANSQCLIYSNCSFCYQHFWSQSSQEDSVFEWCLRTLRRLPQNVFLCAHSIPVSAHWDSDYRTHWPSIQHLLWMEKSETPLPQSILRTLFTAEMFPVLSLNMCLIFPASSFNSSPGSFDPFGSLQRPMFHLAVECQILTLN